MGPRAAAGHLCCLAALLATTLLALAWQAHARPLGDDVRARLEDALARELTPRELQRLMSDADVRAALAELFDGWDGVADELRVSRDGKDLVLRTIVRERRCLARIALGAEAPRPSEPTCHDATLPGGDRKLVIDERILDPPEPRAPPPPKRSSPQRVADVAPSPSETQDHEPRGPVDNTVLRRKPAFGALDDLSSPVMQARVAHDTLKDALRRPHWTDPLLPADPVEAGEALRPLELPEPVVEARVESNLRNPFDVARMRTHEPVPHMLTLPPSDQGPALLPALREECVDEWRLKTKTPKPPTLDCYRRVAWHDRLEENDAYQALSRIASIFQLPLLDTVVAIQVKSAVTHQAHRVVWAVMWVAWLEEHPERTAEALAALTLEERRSLRRRLAQWWVDAKLAELRPTLTRLFERHFLGLYPEATDLDGLPSRAFMRDTWLWANNWLAINDARSSESVAAAFGRLSAPEREVIDAFVRDRALAPRWARAAAIIVAR